MSKSLYHYRAAAELTQAQLAARAGVSVQTIVRIESGSNKRGPRGYVVRRLASALGVAASEIDLSQVVPKAERRIRRVRPAVVRAANEVKALGVSQREAARHFGVDQSEVSRFLSGKRRRRTA